ncbi:unnamed protein product [Thelazia callipaeda]|uniref:F-box domain-containing protein n=1 Tax=Thelazia callipaeda TaxID=103827 RepID=A0A0N5D704_THECL|nr:unnamed protein product [Thelazia callipaeda]
MSNDETTAEDNKCKNNLIGMKKNEVVLCRRNSQIVIHYPIGEDLLKEECRWKFLEWYPRCYLPCSINSYYTHPRSCQRKMQSSKVANSSYNAVTISSDDSVMDSIMLDDLPEHIHIQIMQYIHPTERFINVSLVSKYWYKVVNRGIFWREICIHLSWSQTVSKSLQIFLRKLDESCIKLFQAQMHVEKMCINTFEENPFPDKLFISLFPPEMKRMKVLDIGFHPMLSQSLVEFFSKCFPNLQELNVEGTKAFGSHVYSTLLSKGFPNLRKILISNCSLLSAEDYRQFCRISRPIEVLSVDGTTSLGNFSAMYLEKSPFALTLTRLYLDGEDMDDFGFQALTACKNLNLLSISFCENLTDASLDFVKTFPNLGHLHLRKGRKFTFDGLMKLFKLCNNETVMFPVMLRFLDLSECPAVDDRVVDQLTSRISRGPVVDGSILRCKFTLLR